MDDADPPETTRSPAQIAAAAKAQRLAAALRDNLKRRKAAGRAAVVDKPRN